MSQKKGILFYACMMIAFISLLTMTIYHHPNPNNHPTNIGAIEPSIESLWQLMGDHFNQPFPKLVLQLIIILVVTRLVGRLCKLLHQPRVIGEMVAGICLGPTLFGVLAPQTFEYVFPGDGLLPLSTLSQIGLMLFMFIIGLELDLNQVRRASKDALIISHSSIVIPFSMGMGLAYILYPTMGNPTVSPTSFYLFIGIAMSITAFPVLARILKEKQLTQVPLGKMAIICAAIDDTTAWCLLACVTALIKAHSLIGGLMTFLFAIIYIFSMLALIKPVLMRHCHHWKQTNQSHKVLVAGILLLLTSSLLTELIGIHAIFGAFFAGTLLSSVPEFTTLFREKIEDLTLTLFLPIFFVITGLRTEFNFHLGTGFWTIAGLIILVAIVGKLLGSAITARVVGRTWKESILLGVLLNTRGLMELVVLNIGFDLGVIDKNIFSMMVLMAMITTLMTSPLMQLCQKLFKMSAPIPKDDSPVER